MKNGDSNTQTTQQYIPWEGIQGELGQTAGNLNQPQYLRPRAYTGETVSPFSSLQNTAFGIIPESIGQQLQGNQSQLGAMNFVLNDIMKPETNPYLKQTADSAVDSVFRSFNQNVLPGITDQAVAAGGVGGTRQGVATGVAAGRAVDQAGEIAANIYNTGYGQNLNAYTQTLLGSPNLIQSFATPANTAMGFGAIQQGQNQQLLDAKRQQFEFNRDAPYNRMSEYLRTLMGIPGGQSTTAPGPQTNPWMTGLGAASSTYGMTGNPYLAAFAGAAGAMSS